MSAPRTVAELGEFGLIERIARGLPSPPDGEIWSGDDAAVLPRPPGDLVVSTDVLVEDVDFSTSWASGADVGWKAVAANLSDLAAMGAFPWRAVATLALPSTTSIEFVDRVIEGIVAAASVHQLGLVGGDISRADKIVLGLTVLGLVEGPVVARSGAREGDGIYVTGRLGGARAGLDILRGASDVSEEHRDALVARQLRPTARVQEGGALRRAGATAMIDVSDGLIADLTHLLDASGLGCRLDPDLVPVDDGVPDPGYALYGGEDLELLFTMPPGREAAAESVGATRIGVSAREGRSLGDIAFEDLEGAGWDHLRGR
jgi:thiamine-monophosphate kinase